MGTSLLLSLLLLSGIFVVVSSKSIQGENINDDVILRVKRANSLSKQHNITKTIVRKEPTKQKDWRQEIHLSPLEIATIAAICLLIVGALVYCIYQYIAYCCRSKNKIKRVNSSESLASSRNWKSVRRGSRDSDGRWSRSSNGSTDNWMAERKWAY